MRYYYTLRIHTPKKNHFYLNGLLGVTANAKNGWAYEIVEEEKDTSINFIDVFLKILEGKEKDLESIGIDNSDIEFWMVYEYDDQCNIEFSPKDLIRVGEKDISLCISCYESN